VRTLKEKKKILLKNTQREVEKEVGRALFGKPLDKNAIKLENIIFFTTSQTQIQHLKRPQGSLPRLSINAHLCFYF
jgi:hypothetical protein